MCEESSGGVSEPGLFCSSGEEMGGGEGGNAFLYPCLGSFLSEEERVSRRERWEEGAGNAAELFLLRFGFKTEPEANVWRFTIQMRGRPSRVLQPQFCLTVFFFCVVVLRVSLGMFAEHFSGKHFGFFFFLFFFFFLP